MQQLVMNSSEELSLIVEAAIDIAVGGDSATAAIISFVNYFQQLKLFKPCSTRLMHVIIILIFQTWFRIILLYHL